MFLPGYTGLFNEILRSIDRSIGVRNKMADAHWSIIYYIFYSLIGNELSPSDKIDLIHDTNFILRSKIICLK